VLALGTVQFGMPYGITNVNGQVSKTEVVSILDAARRLSIRTLDTAFEYGSSEELLGTVGVQDFEVVTKLPAQLPINANPYEWIRSNAVLARNRINVSTLTGLLFHRPEHVGTLESKELANVIQSLRSAKIVEKVGVSVYSPHELDAVLSVFVPDIVQLPYNAFDQRFRKSGWLDKLADLGVDVHIRSVFLQGVLLEGIDKLPNRFQKWSDSFSSWARACHECGDNRISAALASVKHDAIKRIVVGVQTQQQLAEINDSFLQSRSLSVPDVSTDDEDLILPVNWSV
jgi:aryl-alcohol dehydrogenase-like predicted oxidoreductase